MRKIFIFLFSFTFMLFFSGCSWMSEIYVFNFTDNVVFVHIAFFDGEGNGFKAPFTAYHINELKVENVDLGEPVPISVETGKGDEKIIKLPSQSALRIGEALDMDMQSSEACSQFTNCLRKLEVVSAEGTLLNCMGDQCGERLRGFSRAQAGYIIENKN